MSGPVAAFDERACARRSTAGFVSCSDASHVAERERRVNQDRKDQSILPQRISPVKMRRLRIAALLPFFCAMKFLHLNFLPRSADASLLVLRVWHAGALLLLHGWGKVAGFSAMAEKFVDPFGFGKTTSLVLAIGGEVVCASLLILGLFTRVAALGAGATMATAFWFAHGGKLSGAGSGELAFVYLGVCIALFIAGAGKYSIDARMGAGKL
jgi:putative oxidoreductase